ncbi:MAG: hypothetical protein U0520_02840 [Candidatus Saccharimonadales bacterium]
MMTTDTLTKDLSQDSHYDAFDHTLRPFAVEQGYEEWGDWAGHIVSVFHEKLHDLEGESNLTHEEVLDVGQYSFEVVRSACELGYFSRAIHQEVEVDSRFGAFLTQTILGEDYEDLEARSNFTLSLLKNGPENLRKLRRAPLRDRVRASLHFIQSVTPGFESDEQIMDLVISPDSSEWKQAREDRVKALYEQLKYLPALAKQAYLWGRTGSRAFLHADIDDPSTIAHHDGLVTTDTDLEQLKIEAAMEAFDDTENVPTYSTLGRIVIRHKGRKIARQYGLRRNDYDLEWVRYHSQVQINRAQEEDRLRTEFRSSPPVLDY